MRLIRILVPTFVLTFLSSAQAQPAVVAVMPVQGVNLTEGQCEAVGVLFANALARETNVAVASPMETKQVLQQTKTSRAAATQLGALEYVELRAIQLGARVTLAGIRYAKDGRELFRAETSALSLDDMEAATAQLARALAWRQPIPGVLPPTAVTETGETPPVAGPAPSAKGYPSTLGVKTGLIIPIASGRSISPMMSLQFDGRMGTRDYFVEFGAGVAIATDNGDSSTSYRIDGVFAELGGSYYLSNGSIAPYIGGGVSPRILASSVRSPNSMYGDTYYSDDSNTGARCALYGQVGVNFSRDSRSRIYSELRVSQNVIGFSNQVTNSNNVSVSTGTYYPTEFALQVGIGW
jgi:hypothetical protein